MNSIALRGNSIHQSNASGIFRSSVRSFDICGFHARIKNGRRTAKHHTCFRVRTGLGIRYSARFSGRTPTTEDKAVDQGGDVKASAALRYRLAL